MRLIAHLADHSGWHAGALEKNPMSGNLKSRKTRGVYLSY